MSVRSIVLASAALAALIAFPVRADAADEPAAKDGKAATPKTVGKTKGTPAAKSVKAIRKAPAPRHKREALARMSRIRVNVDFKEESFERVVRFVGAVAGFDVIVGPELQREGVEIAPITMKLRGVTVKRLAELVARFSKTTLYFHKGILEFTTAKAARGEPVLKIYSIADFTTPIRHFPGPDLNLRPSGAEFEQEEESEVPGAFGDTDAVAEMITEMVEPESWEEDGVSVAAHTGKLVIRTYPAIHRKIARFLMLLRAHG